MRLCTKRRLLRWLRCSCVGTRPLRDLVHARLLAKVLRARPALQLQVLCARLSLDGFSVLLALYTARGCN